jgi:predicted site-specific integrase-resolvase
MKTAKYNELLTYTEYAKLKGVSLKTVYNHVKAGNIIPVIIGKAKFIRYEKNN